MDNEQKAKLRRVVRNVSEGIGYVAVTTCALGGGLLGATTTPIEETLKISFGAGCGTYLGFCAGGFLCDYLRDLAKKRLFKDKDDDLSL